MDEQPRDASGAGDIPTPPNESAAETAEADDEPGNDDQEEDDEEEVDDQIAGGAKQVAEPPQEEGGEDDDEEPAMTQSEIRSKQINQQIDVALRVGKKRTKKRKAGEEDLDQLADEEVERLKQDMIAAADADIDANENKRPATEKLKLLPKVVSMLQKSHLQQSIMDNNLLEGVKRWLEPLPDRSLPALNIQRQFFTIMEKMQIDEISLKMSGLGKIVLFYSACPRIEPAIKRTAEKLIEVWSRPILKRSSSYRTRAVPQAEYHGIDDSQDDRTQLSQADSSRRNVRIPQAVQTGYTYAPKSTAGAIGQEESHQARLTNHRRLNDFKGRLKGKR